ncbi:MAG: T9SS type A sorting domain-containing protein [Bacteroidaceae bacterium]|nr:T9SS type A sorting domain-containing protein [Bacteroidaceae bacterium]
MKHITLLLMAAATICTSAFAQPRPKYVYTSSTTLNVEQLQNQAQPTILNRTLLAGYNTICLPMSLNAEQLQAAAKDVQVERLEMIRQEGNTLCMYFLDCTNEGIQAGVPYLIFSPTLQNLRANTQNASGISTELQSICKSDGAGNTVTFGSSWETIQMAGRYGIPAQQDTYILESILIRTEGDKAFLPTRCGFTWDQQTSDATELEIKHVTSMQDIETSIEKLEQADATVDIYNAQGTLVLSRTNINAAKKSLPQGIYVVKGQKFAVK